MPHVLEYKKKSNGRFARRRNTGGEQKCQLRNISMSIRSAGASLDSAYACPGMTTARHQQLMVTNNAESTVTCFIGLPSLVCKKKTLFYGYSTAILLFTRPIKGLGRFYHIIV
jgi:hypothetical protein